MKRLLWRLVALAVCIVVARTVMSLRRNAESPLVIGAALPPGTIEPQVSTTWDLAYLLAPDGSLWAWGGTQFGSADVQSPGASELGLDITKRYKRIPTLISAEAVAELKEFKSTDAERHIGAAVTLTDIEDKLAKEYPELGGMLRVYGSRQFRNRATMGGNIVTGDV